MTPRTALAVALTAFACGGGDGEVVPTVDLSRPVSVDVDAPAAEHLASYNLFAWDPTDTGVGFTWNDRVLPYELNSALFSDFALKARAIYVPEGAPAATVGVDELLELPVGAVIVKNFYFPADLRAPTVGRRLIETRVLVHASGFRQPPYADIKPQGVSADETRRSAAAEAEKREGREGRTGTSTDAPSKLWHSSPGSSGRRPGDPLQTT